MDPRKTLPKAPHREGKDVIQSQNRWGVPLKLSILRKEKAIESIIPQRNIPTLEITHQMQENTQSTPPIGTEYLKKRKNKGELENPRRKYSLYINIYNPFWTKKRTKDNNIPLPEEPVDGIIDFVCPMGWLNTKLQIVNERSVFFLHNKPFESIINGYLIQQNAYHGCPE